MRCDSAFSLYATRLEFKFQLFSLGRILFRETAAGRRPVSPGRRGRRGK